MRALTMTVVAATLLLTACATARTETGSGNRASNRVTQEQLAATNAETLYDAISKLHPDWLTTRGPSSVSDPTPTSASVFMNGSLLGRVDYLRQMRVLDVTEVRYWESGPAAARFGMGHPRGVIEVTRK
jgi:hypothetical protein